MEFVVILHVQVEVSSDAFHAEYFRITHHQCVIWLPFIKFELIVCFCLYECHAMCIYVMVENVVLGGHTY